MTITWHGLSCFSIRTKTGASEEVTIVVDPYDNETGLRFPRTLSADITAVSEDSAETNNTEAIAGTTFLINEPGEYEVKGVFVYGISVPRAEANGKNPRMVFQIVSEGMSVAILGALDRVLTAEELARFENVDILILPVGGGGALDAKRAGEVVSEIEPRVVIPMRYDIPNLKIKLDGVEKFLKEMGVGKVEALPRLKISKKDLPEEMEVKVLERD